MDISGISTMHELIMSSPELDALIELSGISPEAAINGRYFLLYANLAQSYLLGLSKGRGLTNARTKEIGWGHFFRVAHNIPDNPRKHPEAIPRLFRETENYLDRWEMYNRLFGGENGSSAPQ